MAINSKSDLFKIGLYQIIGGGLGILIIIYSLISTTQSLGLNILVFAFMFIFFAYSVFCGILCLKSKETALRHSLINQILQLLGFAFFGFAFSYVAGLYLSVGLNLTNSTTFTFNFGVSKFDFNINREGERAEINFNLVAFGLIYWIDKLMRKVKAERDLATIDSLSQT